MDGSRLSGDLGGVRRLWAPVRARGVQRAALQTTRTEEGDAPEPLAPWAELRHSYRILEMDALITRSPEAGHAPHDRSGWNRRGDSRGHGRSALVPRRRHDLR